MKRLETLSYGALLLVTLAAAWMVRNAEEPEEETGAVVFDPGPAGIKSMVWDDETSVATIEAQGKGDDLSTWVIAGKKEKIETEVPADDDDSADAGDDDSAETTQPATRTKVTYGEPILRQFPGNATANKLVESFSPLKALRTFEALDADALAQMGLDEPKGSLRVETASGTTTFEIGEKSYGSSDTYVRVAGKNTVFLVASKDLSPLRGAENRMVERVLLDAEDADITEAAITVGGAPAGAPRVHQGRHDKNNSFWASKSTPEEKDSVFGGFIEKVLQLRASSYPTDAEAPAESDLESVFAMTFEGERGALGTIELGRTVDAERSAGPETVYAFYARSDRTRQRWAQVSPATGGDLADQLNQLIE
jgi:hypothetical protein